MERFDSLEERVEYGLDEIDPDATVEVPLCDLLYVYKTLGQLVRFFQNPGHYPDLKSLTDFLGDGDDGALRILYESYYEKLNDVWPEDVQSALQDGILELPEADLTYDEDDEEFDDEMGELDDLEEFGDYDELDDVSDDDDRY